MIVPCQEGSETRVKAMISNGELAVFPTSAQLHRVGRANLKSTKVPLGAFLDWLVCKVRSEEADDSPTAGRLILRGGGL